MTVEHKLILGLDEIKSIVFECSTVGCGAKVVLPADGINNVPLSCPRQHTWAWSNPALIDRNNTAAVPLVQFLQSLRKLRDPLVQESAGFKISLELDEPS